MVEVNALLTGSGAFTATSERSAWLRAVPGTPSSAWTARRRWSSYGSEVDAGVYQTGGYGTGPGYRHALYSIYELPNTGTGGYNRMFRLIHTGQLSLVGATQLHVHWFFSGGDGYGGNLQQRLILDGTSYSPTGASVLVDGIYRTTYNINPTTTVNTVAMQWENLDQPMWQVHFDDIVRTPAAIQIPQRAADLTGSGAFTAETSAIVTTPSVGVVLPGAGLFTAETSVVGETPSVGAVMIGSGSFEAVTSVINTTPHVGAMFAGWGEFTATAVTGGVHPVSGPLIGAGAFTAVVRAAESSVILGDVQTATAQTIDGKALAPVPATLLVFESELEQAPDTLTVAMANLVPFAEVTFTVDGLAVGTAEADGNGDITTLTLDIDRRFLAGAHTVTGTSGGLVASAPFTLAQSPANFPAAQPQDDDPVVVEGTVGANGVHRWVLQDLAPGGLGSWVMPINPSSMSSPHVRKTVADQQTTAVNGRSHLFEGMAPLDWEASGFCPDREFYNKLVQFAQLPRRFYVIDHRGRAWTVSIAELDMRPRQRVKDSAGRSQDWLHDYSIKFVLYSQTPKLPVAP